MDRYRGWFFGAISRRRPAVTAEAEWTWHSQQSGKILQVRSASQPGLLPPSWGCGQADPSLLASDYAHPSSLAATAKLFFLCSRNYFVMLHGKWHACAWKGPSLPPRAFSCAGSTLSVLGGARSGSGSQNRSYPRISWQLQCQAALCAWLCPFGAHSFFAQLCSLRTQRRSPHPPVLLRRRA